MKKLKTYTAVVKIGNGTPEVGFFKTTVEVEAFSEKKAKENALKLALSSTDVTVELSPGKVKGINPVYTEFLETPSRGKNSRGLAEIIAMYV